MSGPTPSPSMNGMIGWSGTESFPLTRRIVSPSAGGVILSNFVIIVGGIRELYHPSFERVNDSNRQFSAFTHFESETRRGQDRPFRSLAGPAFCAFSRPPCSARI